MTQFRRSGLWLFILGIFTVVAILAQSVYAPILAIMLGGAVAATLLRFNAPRRSSLVGAVQQATSGVRVSSQAKEATARASTRGYVGSSHLVLTDVGLIASAQTEEGMVMRRTRSISKDDDGVRPFIVLNVAPSEADRNAKLRFEMVDQSGRDLYVHEMNVYLRDGELNILADHHLPLLSNLQVEGSGDWDLRVFLDGELMAIHSFALTPSDEERANRLTGNVRSRRYVMPEAEEEAEEPYISLEDLLRGQQNNHHRNSKN